MREHAFRQRQSSLRFSPYAYHCRSTHSRAKATVRFGGLRTRAADGAPGASNRWHSTTRYACRAVVSIAQRAEILEVNHRRDDIAQFYCAFHEPERGVVLIRSRGHDLGYRLPRRVIRTVVLVFRTRSRTPRQVALNFETAISSMQASTWPIIYAIVTLIGQRSYGS